MSEIARPLTRASSSSIPADARSRSRFRARIVGGCLLTALMLGVVGCRTMPLENVSNAPIGGSFTIEQVTDKIASACKRRGWTVRVVAPGRIEASLVTRVHMARIEIAYDLTRYSITYVDSENLRYDGENIHKNYVRWIRNLNREIGLALSY